MHRIGSHRPSPALVVAVLALLTATGGIALAAGTSGTTIQGCVQTQTGYLRVVNDPSQCRVTERPLSWNQQGPQGPAGPQGPIGPPGANGTSVVARARFTGSMTLHPGVNNDVIESVPLTGGTWTQAPNEVDQFVGRWTLSPTANCSAAIIIDLDGNDIGFGQVPLATGSPIDFSFFQPGRVPLVLFEPGTPSGHTLTARIESTCTSAQAAQNPPTLTSVDIDVLGAR